VVVLAGEDEKARDIIKRFTELSSIFPRGIDLVELEEMARETARELSKRIPRPREVVTKFFDKRDWYVRYSLDIIKTYNMGKLRELLVRSPSSNFEIRVFADGVEIINRSYSELEEISPTLSTIDAYQEEDSGLYILRIENISWITQFQLSLKANTPITFNQILAIWDEKITY